MGSGEGDGEDALGGQIVVVDRLDLRTRFALSHRINNDNYLVSVWIADERHFGPLVPACIASALELDHERGRLAAVGDGAQRDLSFQIAMAYLAGERYDGSDAVLVVARIDDGAAYPSP
jgi:hypothetical protein